MRASPIEKWSVLVTGISRSADSEWAQTGSLSCWRKPPRGDLVSDLDLRIDLAVRAVLRDHCPEVPVLSEELGWLLPTEETGSPWAAIVDPIDGTDSLVQGLDSWWVSVGLVQGGAPRAGMIYQPTTGVLHDSRVPRPLAPATTSVGMSPDQIDDESVAPMRRRFASDGVEFTAIPHAVEKVAAVLDGRCQACLYLPSAKSPGWHSWDLAAGLAVAEANGLVLRALRGGPLSLGLDGLQRSPWICARNGEIWEAMRVAVDRCLDER